MSARRSRPWLLSLLIHVFVGAVFLLLLSFRVSPVTAAVRMHLLQPGSSAGLSRPKAGATDWRIAPEATQNPENALLPAWQTITPEPAAAGPVPVAASLDEILGPGLPSRKPAQSFQPMGNGGWVNAAGEGYSAPPLPPPGLAPPQGSRWSLLISVPGSGGLATEVEGLDSGHPELDRWLEEYLRTVSFPPSPDGQPYQTHWSLRLESGKPQ